MKDNKNKCKLCGKKLSLEDDTNHKWCEECRNGFELISFLKDKMLPIDEKTILDNIDNFIINKSIDDFVFNPSSLEKYIELNGSLEQYEKIKSRSKAIRKKLKIKK
tara:strand:- start:6854 stop:7171 length:318 start_codon:yes stop_codon:yes gene_type:complete